MKDLKCIEALKESMAKELVLVAVLSYILFLPLLSISDAAYYCALWSTEEHLERYDTSSATSNVVNAKLPGMKSKTLALPAAHRVGPSRR